MSTPELGLEPELSPPWYTLRNQIAATIGNDPSVKVSELDRSQSPYLVKVTIAGLPKAQAHASIMKLFHDGGSWGLKVAIYEQGGQPVSPVVPQSAEQLAEFVRTAFANNPWFVDVHTRPLTMGGRLAVFPIFSKAVIQFPNDDIGDWYFNFNQVVAKAFGNVLEGAPGGIILSVSTDK